MNPQQLYDTLDRELDSIKQAKTFKYEVPLESQQGGDVVVDGREVVMLASNNYLGLSNHPRIKEAARRALDQWGYGLASVRFLCGTEPIHIDLENRIASFVGCEAAILHSSAFSANEAFFSGLLANDLGATGYQDVIYSDQLNHASIIDGIRLCRGIAKQTVSRPYPHSDAARLAQMLEEDRDKNYRIKIIATDGTFSMEGDLAPLPELVKLAREHGRGTHEDLGMFGQIDIVTGTFGKALGGACGGFIAGRKPLIEFLRQKSRPYTFSNTMPPMVVAGSIEAINMIESDQSLVDALHANTEYFRDQIVRLGFKIIEGRHPIVPVMLGEAALAQDMSRELLGEGVYIKGLWYPVVPKGEARLRAQISAAHTRQDLDRALSAFEKVGKRLGVI